MASAGMIKYIALCCACSFSAAMEVQLPVMLNIDWMRLPDPPAQGPSGGYKGFQDSDGGWISKDTVVTAFGYTGGGEPLGFLNSAHLLNISEQDAVWVSLPPAPVPGRQEVGAAVIDGALYYVGGFSYDAPYTYPDVLKLSKNASGAWSWSQMPPLPNPLASMGVASIGSKLYVFGGVDYDSKAFYVFSDRHGKNKGLGRRLFVLDTANASAQWQRLPDVPGSPRWCHAFTGVGQKLYVLGGAIVNSSTVVDNWVFDPGAESWSRLPDLPKSSGNFQTNDQGVFQDRYIILVGGYQFENVYYPNGTSGLPYGGPAHRMCPSNITDAGCLSHCPASGSIPNKHYMGNNWALEYENDVFVFDTKTSTFGTVRATSTKEVDLLPEGCGGYPINANVPQINIQGDQIFGIGGECNDRIIAGDYYTHYPQLAVLGRISAAQVDMVV